MNPLANATIAFIGCGAMGEAMVTGLLRDGQMQVSQLLASDPRAEQRKELAERHGLRVEASNTVAATAATAIVLAVKPQVMPAVLAELKGKLRPDQLVLSISAGTTVATIVSGLDHPAVARAMPNTPAQIGAGITVWTATAAVTEAQRAVAAAILGSLGRSIFVADEVQIAAATALSGSGPAYVFLMIEAMIDAGVQLGFARDLASELVVQTVLGSALFAQATGRHPAELRNMVTSPAGTTAAALYELERGGLRATLASAILAAHRRSLEMSGPPQPAAR